MLPITKSAASITLLRDDGARAFPSVEAATARSAISIARAGTSDELRSSTVSSPLAGGRWSCVNCSGGSGRSSGSSRGSGRTKNRGRSGLLTAEEACGDVVRLRITESASSVALLGNDGTSAFAGIEATAAGRTVGVASARTSDELCTLSDDQEGH